MRSSMSDNTVLDFARDIGDPVQLLSAIKTAFLQKSRAAKRDASRAFYSFSHKEVELADETISRFEKITETCIDAGVQLDKEMIEQKLLELCNERYDKLQGLWEILKADEMNLQELKDEMRKVDLRY